MRSIYWKEISSFLSGLTGSLVLIIFLMITGLFMWVFSNTSILNYNYASLGQLFTIAPLVFIFLIPAITMGSFADEKQLGTMEFLNTKPLTDFQIVMGKYLAALSLVGLALIPTILYLFSVIQLGSPKGNIDIGAVMGSYIGLFFLASIFTSIGIFTSTLTSNQIVAFMIAAFMCFVFYWAFDFLSDLPIFYGKSDELVQYFGIEYHYSNISQGRIDSRDLVYFISLSGFFIWMSIISLTKRNWQ